MENFHEFMKNPKNRSIDKYQYTQSVEDYFFEGADDSQIAHGTCHTDQTSKDHNHDCDGYMTCIDSQYTMIICDKKTGLWWGDEIFIHKCLTHDGKRSKNKA